MSLHRPTARHRFPHASPSHPRQQPLQCECRKPQHDLPVLWSLAVDLHKAAAVVLASESYAYLTEMFHDRRNPQASRLHYALAKVESEIAADIQTRLADEIPDVRVVVWIYDGCVLKVPCREVGRVRELLCGIGATWGVEFETKSFSAAE